MNQPPSALHEAEGILSQTPNKQLVGFQNPQSDLPD